MLISLGLLCLGGCNAQKQDSPTIAEVNGDKVIQSEFDQQYAMIKTNIEIQQGVALDEEKDKELIKNIKDKTFDDLIMRKLVLQETKKQGINISDQEIDSTLNYLKANKNQAGADGFNKFLQQIKLSEKDLRKEIETSLLYTKLEGKVAAGIKVSDADAQKYFNDNTENYQDPGGIQIYHILVDSEAKATEVMAKIKQGGDFAALAKEYSSDPGSKDKGGDVGFVNATTNFVPEFKQAALALQPGQLSPQPVKSQFGYHIIKAGDKKAAMQLPFEQVKIQLIQQMEQDQKDKAFNTYLEKLKSTATIKDMRS